MSVFTGVDLVTLSTWLTEAQVAYHALNTGTQVVSLAQGEERLTFTAADPDKLKQYILDLQAAIAALSGGGTRRKGVYLVGGKGL